MHALSGSLSCTHSLALAGSLALLVLALFLVHTLWIWLSGGVPYLRPLALWLISMTGSDFVSVTLSDSCRSLSDSCCCRSRCARNEELKSNGRRQKAAGNLDKLQHRQTEASDAAQILWPRLRSLKNTIIAAHDSVQDDSERLHYWGMHAARSAR